MMMRKVTNTVFLLAKCQGRAVLCEQKFHALTECVSAPSLSQCLSFSPTWALSSEPHEPQPLPRYLTAGLSFYPLNAVNH